MASNTIEEAAFELVEQFGAAELEKLAKYLELLVFGKKSLEADKPAPRVSSPKPKGGKASQAETTPDPSSSEDEAF